MSISTSETKPASSFALDGSRSTVLLAPSRQGEQETRREGDRETQDKETRSDGDQGQGYKE
jgi:hypothetical protein